MQVFITFLLATMAAATPVSTESKFVISHDLTMRELEASNKLLFDDSKIAPRDDYGSCNWVRCSQGDTVLWSAACRGDPKPASLCAICNWSGATPTCYQARSADAGGSAAIMQCGDQLATLGC